MDRPKVPKQKFHPGTDLLPVLLCSYFGMAVASLYHLWLLQLVVALSHQLRYRFLQLSVRVWQGLYSMLPPVHRSEDSSNRHVFFPEGMISCLPRRKLGM